MISHEILATGSKGNGVIVGKSVLIDCGIAFKRIAPKLDEIKIVLLTHIHGDHFLPSTIRRLASEKPLLRFGACEWMIKPLLDAGVKLQQIDMYKIGNAYDYQQFKVIPFPLVHDVPNCGYKIHFPGGRAIYATDTKTLAGITAKNYDLYLIEGNYEASEIRQRIKEKELAGGYVYERRVLETHLSKENCDDFIARNCGGNGQFVYLHEHMEDEPCLGA